MTDQSAQQDESRKRARDKEKEEEHPKKLKPYNDEGDSDDDTYPLKRRLILQGIRELYAGHTARFLANQRLTTPIPSRSSVNPCDSKKQSLSELIHGVPGRISLSLDLWTSSNHQDYYVVLTGHFTDDGDWNLHRRILNLVAIPSASLEDVVHQAILPSASLEDVVHQAILPSASLEDVVHQAILTCVSNWNLNGRLFALTVDHSLCSSIENLEQLHTQLLIRHCYARVISGLAQDALGSMSPTITKIRESIKFVKSSEFRYTKFLELKQHLDIRSKKKLFIDEQTKWDTTYHMLVAALKLKNVFGGLSSYDPDFKIDVSPEEWKQVETLLTYMKYFFDAANMVNAHQYPCANAFFTVVAKIQEELMRAATSEDSFLKLLTTPLLQKFEKYWESCYIILAVAVVFDPRLKMAMVQKVFYQIYGENAVTRMEIVRNALSDLWFQYALPEETPTENEGVSTIKTEPPTASQGEQPLDRTSNTDFDMMMLSWFERQRAPKKKTSELDQYLEETLYEVPVKDFDVLVWWMQNKARYPTLSRMASDVLAIPLSTLDSDFVFDTATFKTMDSSLSPSTLEALICDKDWLK